MKGSVSRFLVNTCLLAAWAVGVYVVGVVIGKAPVTGSAQTCSGCPTLNRTGHYWESGKTVHVSFSGFSPEQITKLKTVLSNWETGFSSGPRFSFDPPPAGARTLSVQHTTPDQPSRASYTTRWDSNNQYVIGATIKIDTAVTNELALRIAMSHEVAHTYGMDHCTDINACNCSKEFSVMGASAPGANDTLGGEAATKPMDCDKPVLQDIFSRPPGGGTGGGGGGGDPCPPDPGNCPPDTIWDPCLRQCVRDISPVAIDVGGDGFDLTSAEEGVFFDINADGTLEQLSWVAAGSDDAWLALDRNGNGSVDSGRELFGNFTAQPPSDEPNGFIALAEFDKAHGGGNGDGVVDSNDAIYPNLWLWQDVNHNGVSEPGELHTLAALNVAAISLDYREVRRRDRHGNQFRYQAPVTGTDNRTLRRLAYDVFLKRAP